VHQLLELRLAVVPVIFSRNAFSHQAALSLNDLTALILRGR